MHHKHLYFLATLVCKSLVIRQEGESQNGCFKKTKRVKFSEKFFLPPDTGTFVYISGGNECLFFRKIWRALFS